MNFSSRLLTSFLRFLKALLGLLMICDIENKCEYLLRDDPEMWSFDDDKETSTSSYIVMLEKELESLNNSVDTLRNQAAMGLDIEDHLKKKVHELEKEKILSYDAMKNRILELRHFHTQNRCEVMSFLEQEKNQFKSILDAVQERIQFQANMTDNSERDQMVAKSEDLECRDVHITTDTDLVPQSPPALPRALGDEMGDTSDVLAQALQEKVGALLLLSQQDERQLLERNVNAALQEKMDELQKNLLQVTNEKVKALLELAQLRQEYQVLQEDIIHERKQGNHLADIGEKNISTQETEVGKLKNLLKKTYLSRWVRRHDPSGNETGSQMNNKSNNSVDYARLIVENATLKESIETMEHLTSSIHRLRLSLVKAKDSSISLDPVTDTIQALNDIISEAKLIKTALGSSLPASWLSKAENETQAHDISESSPDPSSERPDFVSTSGLEMVELLILAAQILVANVNLLSVLPSQQDTL